MSLCSWGTLWLRPEAHLLLLHFSQTPSAQGSPDPLQQRWNFLPHAGRWQARHDLEMEINLLWAQKRPKDLSSTMLRKQLYFQKTIEKHPEKATSLHELQPSHLRHGGD